VERGAGDHGGRGAVGALAGFGLDSLIEIGASIVVIWELSGTGEQRQRRGLRLIGAAFAALAAYLLVQSTVVLATGYHPRHSVPRIILTAVTAAVMFALAAGKARTVVGIPLSGWRPRRVGNGCRSVVTGRWRSRRFARPRPGGLR
jgi:hypothetical protein